MTDGTLAAIHLHPVKSCRRLVVESATVSATGLEDDRIWQLVEDDGTPVTQRQHKQLALVRPELLDGGLRLSAPGHGSIDIGRPGDTDKTVEARSLFKVPVEAADAGDEAAAWFSRLLGQPVRLAGLLNDGWKIPAAFELPEQPMAFVDAAPELVTTTSSLDWLVAHASEPFTIDRFRPNLVVDNQKPWVEDTWKVFTIGDAELTTSLPWPRCAIPQIDQDTADRHNEPAKAMRAHRWCTAAPDLPEATRRIIEGNGLFGIGCTIGAPGTKLEVGAPVHVSSTAAPLIAAPSA